MKETDDNAAFINKVKDRFDRSVEAIDAETASRITRARHRALEQDHARRPARVWLPAGAVAALCLALVIYVLVPDTREEAVPVLEEMDLISDLELYENLEFYEWLEEYELPG